MIQQIRTSKFSKIIASYLALQMILTVIHPSNLFALTSGPSQPEFNSFTPIGTSDMVNLSTGDFNYNIPIMDVGGYPLNLSYDSGVTMDQEASWVGLGWNLNVGQIKRQVRGIPDDFKGDVMTYEDNIKENKTVGLTFNINAQFFGLLDDGLGASSGLTIQHNNYNGVSFKPSHGISFDITNNISAGMQLSSSADDGVNFSPSLSISEKGNQISKGAELGLGSNIGVGYNSRQGLSTFTIGSSLNNSNGSSAISLINQTFTPRKRTPYYHATASYAFSAGFDAWGIDAEAGITGFGMSQRLYNPLDPDGEETGPGIVRNLNAYGYNHTQEASNNSILDFNNEKEDIVSKNTLVLPVTNYTHDLFQINGQGTGGTFRPMRNQVGYLFNGKVQDVTSSYNFGGEFEGGSGVHVGLDFNEVSGISRTNVWDSPVLDFFKELPDEEKGYDYEEIYYKKIGEPSIDRESGLLNEQLGGTQPIRIGLGGANYSFGRFAKNTYEKKTFTNSPPGTDGSSIYTPPIPFDSYINREKRDLRNTAIIPLTYEESERDPLFDFIEDHPNAESHHLAGYKVLQPDGSRYIYGETVYNKLQEELTFAVDKDTPDLNAWEYRNGIVQYTDQEISRSNTSSRDHYFNKIQTPPFAHSFLLTSVLSTDYEDLKNDGPTPDDLGSYTKFNYRTHEPEFYWKTPFSWKKASFNEGLNSDENDQKGSVIRGVKELKYINTIETKTHVAYFLLSNRDDGKASSGTGIYTQKLEKILLFSKPELDDFLVGGDINAADLNDLLKLTIKVAHLEYDYELCEGLPSNINNDGKLTLKSLYFTYRNSYMGKYTPYKFHYNKELGVDSNNFNYEVKSQDIWGNFKPMPTSNNPNILNTEVSSREFPFVQQEDKELQDWYAGAWSLTTIDLPSGGSIEIDYETDDYQYVQDRKAMKMFKVVGISNDDAEPSVNDIGNDLLYTPGSNYDKEGRQLIVALSESDTLPIIEKQVFVDKYLGDQLDKPIYFRFMLNMSKDGGRTSAPAASNRKFDYVTGYFNIGNYSDISIFRDDPSGVTYAALPMTFTDLEGGVSGGLQINPISKAGWYFGRKYLQREMLGLPIYTNSSFEDIAKQLWKDFISVAELLQGINAKLRNERLIARRFVPEKSWIRLLEPTGSKMGGGARVKEIRMLDNWDEMRSDSFNIGQFYGQQYTYNLEDGTSSGVATYEPNMSKENPFVEPFYHGEEKLISPRELNYVEKPFGEAFFPSSMITYSRVEVKNLERNRVVNNITQKLKRHATGKVVNQFYTSKDFPTIVDYTDLNGPENWASNEDQIIQNILTNLLSLEIQIDTELTLSQGFVVQTNDMNGREKSQAVYNEQGQFISGVDYKYNVDDEGNLNNKVSTINEDGLASKDEEIGVQYEVTNFFNENYVRSNVAGVQGNTAGLPFPIPIIIPLVLPNLSQHTNVLHTVTTTKVIHKSGILKEKIAYDLGSTVSTSNLAWDALTGEVVLTKTENEYNDSYFNFNYPSYWYYKGMGLASKNIGVSGVLEKEEEEFNYTLENASKMLFPGDELWATRIDENGDAEDPGKLWVMSNADSNIQLMDAEGNVIAFACEPETIHFTVIRSGYRNLQKATMASVTSMISPYSINAAGELSGIINADTYDYNYEGNTENPNIINSSAVDYSEGWPSQHQNNLPVFPDNLQSSVYNAHYGQEPAPQNTAIDPRSYGFNPYLYNVRGDWRAKRSLAYLTGRNAPNTNGTLESPEVRKLGYFTKFNPYYTKDVVEGYWRKNFNNWTSASYVTQYSPYGAELENRDALNRYSSAQYGYNYTLPVAVGSNSEYKQIGFDGFEDYDYEGISSNENNPHFKFPTEDGTADITEQEFHTGGNSIKVSSYATLTRDYSQSTTNIELIDPDCSPPPPDCTIIPTGDVTLIDIDSPTSDHYIGTFRIANAASSNLLYCPNFDYPDISNPPDPPAVYCTPVNSKYYVSYVNQLNDDGDDAIIQVFFECRQTNCAPPNTGAMRIPFGVDLDCGSSQDCNCRIIVPLVIE